ncbi:YcxB family protein [Streptomyces sp. NPDC053079]|uniref:YcxB family protein n=1 Tax=Streptomyces sp. NPDC053079 TaxID=3365697 RepID=UPI0037D378D4
MSETVPPGLAADSLTFEYELTPADIRSGLQGRTRAVRSARLQRVLLPVGYALFATALIAPNGPAGVELKDWIALAVGAVMVLLILVMPVVQARAFHKTARLQGRMRTTVDAGGLSGASAQSSQRMAWPLFGRYVERGDVFVLLSADKRGGCMSILPKRALAAPGDVDRLRALLDAHLARV